MGNYANRALATVAEAAVRDHVQQRLPGAVIFSFGAVTIDPALLAIWITTSSDAECQALERDAALLPALREVIARSGYPAEAIPGVAFAFASQETVDRDCGGDWRAYTK